MQEMSLHQKPYEDNTLNEDIFYYDFSDSESPNKV